MISVLFLLPFFNVSNRYNFSYFVSYRWCAFPQNVYIYIRFSFFLIISLTHFLFVSFSFCMDPYEVPIYYRIDQADKFYLLPWMVGIEMGVLALLCNLLRRNCWIVGKGANNCASLYLARQQAIKHLGVPYDFSFAFYRAKLWE